MTRNRWLILIAVVVVGGGVLWAIRAGQSGKLQYRTHTAERSRLVASVSATGTVEPVVQVEVGSQVSGSIANLYADYNDRVEAGQVLVQLEPSLFRAAVVQSEANVARAEAALLEAARSYRRAQELHGRDVISEVDLEVAETLDQQRQAELRQAQAALETARVNLGHTTIRSPISGVVISRNVDVGQTVAASLQAPILFVLAQDLRNMRVESMIDEADVGDIQPGLRAFFTVDAYPEDRFDGDVSQVRLEPVIEDNVVTYATVIEVANPELKLRPGMTANVTIVVASRDSVLRVPNAAFRFRPPADDGGGARAESRSAGRGRPTAAGGSGRAGKAKRGAPRRIFILDEHRKLKPILVHTGISDGSFTEVVSGELSAGDRIVLGVESSSGNSNLAPPPGFGRRRR